MNSMKNFGLQKAVFCMTCWRHNAWTLLVWSVPMSSTSSCRTIFRFVNSNYGPVWQSVSSKEYLIHSISSDKGFLKKFLTYDIFSPFPHFSSFFYSARQEIFFLLYFERIAIYFYIHFDFINIIFSVSYKKSPIFWTDRDSLSWSVKTVRVHWLSDICWPHRWKIVL